MIILHNSMTGNSMKLSSRFSFPSKSIKNYKDEDGSIILIARRMFLNENLWDLGSFIDYNQDRIIGVIVYDDKAFGEEFGSAAKFFKDKGVEILAVWDKTVSSEEIKEMEVRVIGARK